MPARRLTKPKPALYRLSLHLTHHAYDLYPTVGLKVDIEFTDGLKAVVGHWEQNEDDLAGLSTFGQDLLDAFLWGDGTSAVIAQVQAHDRSAQSRRVRKGLPPG